MKNKKLGSPFYKEIVLIFLMITLVKTKIVATKLGPNFEVFGVLNPNMALVLLDWL